MKRKTTALFVCTFLFLGLPFGCKSFSAAEYFADAVHRTDFTSVYEKVGKAVTLDNVFERDGLAYANIDGKEYELGMDFLSMAMVYNATPTQNYPTAESAYNEWWRLFMVRWNYLVPEVPLYSNQYYDVYNGKIDELKTSPYFSVSDAIVSARVTHGENAVAIGSSTDLSGAFRDASFGKSAPASSDLAVQTLTSGYSTVETDRQGVLRWADTKILPLHEESLNADGTKTFTIRIADDLVFSNGEPITAKDYLAPLLVGSSSVMKQAGGSDSAGLTIVGYEEFRQTDGAPFSGVRLLDKYTFSVQIKPEYANYYYALRYGAFTPVYAPLYLGEYQIKDDGAGAYIEQGFYKKSQMGGVERYEIADKIVKNMQDISTFPYTGHYYVDEYDSATRTAKLKRNPLYKGDLRGKAQIERISYVKIVSQTQLDQLKKGRVDVLSGITGGEETRAALAIADGVRFKETHYDRAGYGKLAFRCDFSPTQFREVRRAVMHTIDRNEFAQAFTGGYGSVVHAPYHAGASAYLANKEILKLNPYEYSVDKAKAELQKGGWIYNAQGESYDEKAGGVRYKKLQGYELSYNNLAFASTDNKYRTVKVDGEYYMPLVINWMGTQPNPVTDLLVTSWQNSQSAGAKIGAYITYSSGDMNGALYGEYRQMPAYGFKTARYGAVNFATGFTSAVYDQAFYWTIDQNMYATYSSNYLMDEADFYADA